MSQNETERHFELRNLDADMKKAYNKASRPISQHEAKARSNGMIALALIVAILIGGLVIGFSGYS